MTRLVGGQLAQEIERRGRHADVRDAVQAHLSGVMTMSSEDFVNALYNGKNLEAEDAFKSAMQDKVGQALEIKR